MHPAVPTAFRPEEVLRIREDFPLLSRTVHGGKPLVYLDNAATAQKPQGVIDAVCRTYTQINANVHRGMHALAEEATAAYEASRDALAAFFNAWSREGVVFTRGTTESINLVANSWAAATLQPGDEILVSVMEHHSNLVPWQLAAARTGAVLRAIPLTPEGELDLGAEEAAFTSRTRLLAVTHISNALGTVNPVQDLCRRARAAGITVLIDGAQSAPHLPVDVQALGCDFFVCSAHKMCGPTGVGALIARPELLDAMPPFLGGGEMIDQVRITSSTWADLPYKFEAGTPDISGVIAWHAALEYLGNLGMERIAATTEALVRDAVAKLEAEPGVTLCAHPAHRGGAVSFWLDGIHPHDVAQVVDQSGVAIRAGHVCCQPLMAALGHPAINRASYHFYNRPEETDQLLQALRIARKLFA